MSLATKIDECLSSNFMWTMICQESQVESVDVTRVIAIAKRYLPQGIDYENIAIDILLESWQNGIEQPARMFIRNRCYDAIRRMKSELQANEGAFRDKKLVYPDLKEVETQDLMDKLTSVLSMMEKKAIWYRYYMDLSVSDIGAKLGVGKNRASVLLTEALFKMRQENDD